MKKTVGGIHVRVTGDSKEAVHAFDEVGKAAGRVPDRKSVV